MGSEKSGDGITPENSRFAPKEIQKQFQESQESKGSPEEVVEPVLDKEETPREFEKANEAFGWGKAKEKSKEKSKEKPEKKTLEKKPEVPKTDRTDSLKERGKEYLSWLFKGVSEELKDRAALWYNTDLLDRAGTNLERLRVKKAERDRVLEQAQKKKVDLEGSLRQLENKVGTVRPEIREEMNKEMRATQKVIAQAELQQHLVVVKLSRAEEATQRYESKRNLLVEKFVGRIKEQLAPVEQANQVWEIKLNQIDTEIANASAALVERQKQVAEIQTLLGTSKYDFEKKTYTAKLKELIKLNKQGEKDIQNAYKQRDKVADKFYELEADKNIWLNKIDLLRRHKPEVNEDEALYPKAQSGKTETVPESEIRSLEGDIELWNKQFGSNWKINAKAFLEFVKNNNAIASKNLAQSNFENAMINYYRNIVRANLKEGRYETITSYRDESELRKDLKAFKKKFRRV